MFAYIYIYSTYNYICLHIYNMLIYVSPLNKQIAPEKGWLEYDDFLLRLLPDAAIR